MARLVAGFTQFSFKEIPKPEDLHPIIAMVLRWEYLLLGGIGCILKLEGIKNALRTMNPKELDFAGMHVARQISESKPDMFVGLHRTYASASLRKLVAGVVPVEYLTTDMRNHIRLGR